MNIFDFSHKISSFLGTLKLNECKQSVASLSKAILRILDFSVVFWRFQGWDVNFLDFFGLISSCLEVQKLVHQLFYLALKTFNIMKMAASMSFLTS